MANPRAILFDKDGTLFDFQATWGAFAAELIGEMSGGDETLAEVLASVLQFDLDARRFRPESVFVAGTTEDVANTVIPHLPGAPRRSELIARIDAAATEIPQAEAVPLVPYLADLAGRALRLAVITNDAEVPAVAHLRSVGVADAFDFVAGYDSGFGAKPGPGQILAACAHLGVAPEETVMVGDSTHDLLAGRAAGSATVAVLTGLAGAAELSPLADAVLPDIGHLPEWLDARRG